MVFLEEEFPTWMRRFKRRTQIIRPRDAGLIIGLCGLDKHSVVVEIGAGSGYLSAILSRFFEKVISYERDPEKAKIIEKNLRKIGAQNVEVVAAEPQSLPLGDMYVFDTPQAKEYLEDLPDGVSVVFAYFPNADQAKAFADAAEGLFDERLMMRPHLEIWKTTGRSLRPEFKQLAHTGFWVMLRRKTCTTQWQ